MERSTELMSSAASGSYEVTQTENEDALSERGNNSEETLNLVEGAILRTLQKHSQEAKRAGEAKNAAAAADEGHGSAQAPAKSSNPEDMELLAHLLEQVHDLRKNQRRKPPPSEAQEMLRPTSRRRGRSRIPSEELRVTLEAATMAAKAAADAAEAAALAVARNTEAIEHIMEKKPRKKSKSKRSSDEEKEAIVRSNQWTHWILGFMAITTIAWRFGVVKVAKRVAGKLNDPLGYVGGLMSSNDDEKAVEKSAASADKGNLLDRLPHIDIPELLPNPSDHEKETKPETAAKDKDKAEDKETSLLAKSATAVDVKTKEMEKTAFSFAKLLHIKPKEN